MLSTRKTSEFGRIERANMWTRRASIPNWFATGSSAGFPFTFFLGSNETFPGCRSIGMAIWILAQEKK